MNPVFAVVRSLFDSLWACMQFFLIMLLVSALVASLLESIKKKISNSPEEENSGSKTIFILTLLQIALVIVLVFPSKYDAYTSPSYVMWNIAERYERDYPSTWSYISKHCDDPYDYVVYYDKIWGDLQEYNGDGIVFDTLSSYEQSKVNYPDIGKYIYYTSGSRTYHSTPLCYTLLRSNPYQRLSKFSDMYDPCSKCVGD